MKSRHLVHGLMAMSISMLVACAAVNPWCNDDDCKAVSYEMEGGGGISGGSATYKIALDNIDTSAFYPNLSIHYSSRNGNGILGMGWSVNQYSSIFRCPATPDMDGFASGVRYSPDDRLCADGAHLIPASGRYGKDGAVYRTELHDSFLVREVGDINDPDSYFIETYDNGLRVYYKTPYVPKGAPATLTWNETWMENSSHDVISYKYTDLGPGEKLLSEIRFTGRDEQGTIQDGKNVIRYEYEARPDSTTSFLAGGESLQTQRLADIVMGVDRPKAAGGFQPRRGYEFRYNQSGATGRSLLAGMMHCIYRDGGTKECSTPTMVSWQDTAVTFTPPLAYGTPLPDRASSPAWKSGGTDLPAPPFTRGYDYDGDGRVELLYARAGAPAHLYFTDMSGKLAHDVDVGAYVHETGLDWTRSAGDLINIGAASLFGAVDGHFGFTHWDGKSMEPAVATAIPYSPMMLVADYDGDNYPDLLQLEPVHGGGYALRLYRNGHSSPTKTVFAPPMDILTLPAGHYSLQRPHVYDMDGNGCADAFLVEDGKIADILLFSQDVRGVVHSSAVKPADYGLRSDQAFAPNQFADINGDGLDDLVYVDASGAGGPTWHYQLNTGDGFAPPVDTGIADGRPAGAGHTGTLVADLNTDGRDELLYPAVRLQEYCLSVPDAGGAPKYLCSGDALGTSHPELDLGIYRYAALRFMPDGAGAYKPVTMPEPGIIGQANLTATGDLHGDGLTQVFAPFDPWFSNGGFRGVDGSVTDCPADFGCGLHVASDAFGSSRPDSRDAPPDLVLEVDKGRGTSYDWHYYPLANSIRGLYSVPPVGSPERYLNDDSFYFTSSMYVVGEFSSMERGNLSSWRYDYGGAAYTNGGRGFEGFRWIVTHSVDNHVKFVQWYLQDFPYTGELVSAWGSLESATGDDYLHGEPGDRYVEYVRYTYDCQGPVDRPQSKLAGCLNQGDGSFLVRKRTSRDIERDANSGKVTSDVTTRYNYDPDGNLISTENGP